MIDIKNLKSNDNVTVVFSGPATSFYGYKPIEAIVDSVCDDFITIKMEINGNTYFEKINKLHKLLNDWYSEVIMFKTKEKYDGFANSVSMLLAVKEVFRYATYESLVNSLSKEDIETMYRIASNAILKSERFNK